MPDRRLVALAPLGLGLLLYAASLALGLGPAPRVAGVALLALSGLAKGPVVLRAAGWIAVVGAVVAEALLASTGGAAVLAVVAAAVAATRLLPAFTRWGTDEADHPPEQELDAVLERLEATEAEDVALDAPYELPRLLDRYAPVEVRTWHMAPEQRLRAEPAHDREPDEVVLRAVARGEPAHDRDSTTFVAPLRLGSTVTAWIELRRARPFHAEERKEIERIIHAAGRTEAILRVRRRALLRSRIGELLVQDAPRADVLEAALETLRKELKVRAALLMSYTGGAFRASTVVTDDWPELEALLREDQPLDGGVIGDVYQDGSARFIANYGAHAPTRAALVEAGVRAAVYRPMPRREHAKSHLVVYDDAERLWTDSDRSLVTDVARSLRLWLERDREAKVLERMLEVEHRLLAEASDDATHNLLQELVALVPGAEAGTMLVRQDERFHYAAVIGFVAEDLADVAFEEAHLQAWCGGPDTWLAGQARIASDPAGMERASVEASDGLTQGQASLRSIVANLCMPVVHRGEVLAAINLDAFSDPNAFQNEDLDVAKAFAPAVGFVLSEARHRRDLYIASTRDAVTDLENRRAFDEGMTHELARAERDRTPTGLLIADLTGFKRVNDAFGHSAGDDVLKRVADAMREVARDSDRLYRWGGDEFAVILPNTDAPGTYAAARRFSRAIASIEVEGLGIGASVGMAVRLPGDDVDAEQLLARADQAMYEAKREGAAIAES
jgi:diguanylate cyclase (GGDEF)-like protein